MAKILEVDNVSLSFGRTLVLSEVSFSVDQGDFVGLVGVNGSGKTTLLKLILGQYRLQEGKIRLFGKDIGQFSGWSKVGYVPQKAANILDEFPASVDEIVATGLLSTKRFPKFFSSSDPKKVHSALKKVGMEDFAHTRIGALSGGQQQRVLIARALIARPLLLILDEPTTGVDQATQDTFYEILGQLNQDGISIILVSHDIGRITQHVTKIASLNKTLQFYGSHEDFCRHPAGEKDHHCLMLRKG